MRRWPLALLALPLLNCSSDTIEPIDQSRVMVMQRDACPPPAIDLLLVIDDSPSMRPHQERLAAGLRDLGEGAQGAVDARVAIVTTSGLDGTLVTDTCRSRIDTFVGPGELEEDIADLSELCLSSCPLDTIPRELSPLDEHRLDLAIRPWFESPLDSWGGNLPAGITMVEALACVGLRGFTGAEFESPIAAAAAALERMQTPGDPAYGFMREGVMLQVVFIGDEDDCSHPADSPIFDPAGDRTFWTNPDAHVPTSGVCVLGGTYCDEQGCRAVDRRADGTLAGENDEAVLTPIRQLREQLEEIAEQRKVEVVVFGGVNSNGNLYAWPPGEPSDPDDQPWVEEFGTGWGDFGSYDRRAMAPWRLAAIGESATIESSAVSLVHGSLSEVAGNWPWEVEQGLQPWCLKPGVELGDDSEPSCRMLLHGERVGDVELPPCERDEQGWVIDPVSQGWLPPLGAGACWGWYVDDETPECQGILEDFYPEYAGAAVQIVVSTRNIVPRDSEFQLLCEPED